MDGDKGRILLLINFGHVAVHFTFESLVLHLSLCIFFKHLIIQSKTSFDVQADQKKKPVTGRTAYAHYLP